MGIFKGNANLFEKGPKSHVDRTVYDDSQRTFGIMLTDIRQ